MGYPTTPPETRSLGIENYILLRQRSLPLSTSSSISFVPPPPPRYILREQTGKLPSNSERDPLTHSRNQTHPCRFDENRHANRPQPPSPTPFAAHRVSMYTRSFVIGQQCIVPLSLFARYAMYLPFLFRAIRYDTLFRVFFVLIFFILIFF